ncbi:MAG: SCO family protein [Acetobacteraceae bacterium]|nr:SCO family protein [Acetobacteraceae bacterium]
MPSPPDSRTADPPSLRFLVPLVTGGLVLALVLFGIGVYLWLSGTATAAIGGPFTLENGNGQAVTNRDFRGKYMLVYFGYTYCPDVCPTTLTELAGALDKLGPKAARVQPIFITVDPQRDTPAVIKQYTGAFSPRIVGLTGTPDQIAAVERAYHVYAAKHVTGPGPNDYGMDHSSVLYLMGPDGRFVAPIDADQTAPQLAKRLAGLIT